jgi:hypothetical protein
MSARHAAAAAMRRVIALLRATALLPPVTALLPMTALLLAAAPSVAGEAPLASREQLAPFSGTWILQPAAAAPATERAAGSPRLPLGLRIVLPRVRPEIAARLTQNQAPAPTEARDRPYCRPSMFNGQLGYVLAPNAMLNIAFEILDSPGRLTLLNEVGLVRRIYVRDKLPPELLDENDAGLSLARFEGRTLVVTTTGLNPLARIILPLEETALGRGATVLERITTMGNELEIVTTVTAPELYTAPVTTTNRYRREPDRELVVMNTCVDGDRSWDNSSRLERFDATPPADLPPPPSN